MKKPLVAGAFALVFASLAQEAAAIPAFARRYGTDCSFCHRGYPKLTYEGQRFKERGFRMPGEGGFEAEKWIASVPIVGRGWVNQLFLEEREDQTTGYLKAISAGNLGTRLAYWADDAWLAREEPQNAPSDFDTVTHLKPNNVWGRLELMQAGKLYLKAGRFELDLPFTQIRSPHLFSYDIFSTRTGFESDDIASYQEGGELGTSFGADWHASVAVVRGRNNDSQKANSADVEDFDANVFLRGARRVDRHRFGAFAYFGRNTLAPTPQFAFENKLQRYGLDADVWVGGLNLYGVYMHGRDDNSQGTGVEQSFDGGFVQADWHARPSLVVSARVNLVKRPVGLQKETFASLFPGVRWYFFKHGRVAFEYGFQNQDRNGFGAVQAELVF